MALPTRSQPSSLLASDDDVGARGADLTASGPLERSSARAAKSGPSAPRRGPRARQAARALTPARGSERAQTSRARC